MSKKIAITGGIGSGKSTVLSLLKEGGYSVFSCDEIYKKLFLDEAYIQKIEKLFPTVVQNGRIERQVLADIVFKDKQALEKLNGVAHPLIMRRLYESMQNCTDMLVFAEVPLLFEGNYQSQFDAVIVVQRAKEKRISAIVERDGLTREEAMQRIAAQFDYDSSKEQELYLSPNTFLLSNEGTNLQLRHNLQKILQRLFS
ncbi:MAG: dephospho-CoA kinase [Clostridia bacterium]|nr:dephospho-CoA kinase [Clostridia bacterium]